MVTQFAALRESVAGLERRNPVFPEMLVVGSGRDMAEARPNRRANAANPDTGGAMVSFNRC
jgi:hypothetical protein